VNHTSKKARLPTAEAAKVLCLPLLCIIAGCNGVTNDPARLSLRPLNDIELDGITVGDARASSNTAAHAIGVQPETSTSSGDLSASGGSPISGAPFVDYATSQGNASGRSTQSAQATGNGEIFVGQSGGISAGANFSSTASVTGANAAAQISMQVYGLTTTNSVSLAFGAIGAAACCGPHANAQPAANSFATGPYVAGRQVQQTELTPQAVNDTIDFSIASSAMPMLDPGVLAAATTIHLAPRY
jgi:hypothetical protein